MTAALRWQVVLTVRGFVSEGVPLVEFGLAQNRG